jgi:hypothetical protein
MFQPSLILILIFLSLLHMFRQSSKCSHTLVFSLDVLISKVTATLGPQPDFVSLKKNDAITPTALSVTSTTLRPLPTATVP